MERVGERADKARIKRTLEELLRRQEAAAAQGRAARPPRTNEGLERLKFWLGMPNRYYERGWQASSSGPEERPAAQRLADRRRALDEGASTDDRPG